MKSPPVSDPALATDGAKNFKNGVILPKMREINPLGIPRALPSLVWLSPTPAHRQPRVQRRNLFKSSTYLYLRVPTTVLSKDPDKRVRIALALAVAP
ncbi:hypothetical protein C8R46DRAFT_1213098 [Mycena filopes]|nr:hypothetical protein C8R46DRAFT_1213098 [Mycena filopes]